MQVPIPFFGWVSIDEEDTEQMLREQIQSQQTEIDRLNKKIVELQLVTPQTKTKG